MGSFKACCNHLHNEPKVSRGVILPSEGLIVENPSQTSYRKGGMICTATTFRAPHPCEEGQGLESPAKLLLNSQRRSSMPPPDSIKAPPFSSATFDTKVHLSTEIGLTAISGSIDNRLHTHGKNGMAVARRASDGIREGLSSSSFPWRRNHVIAMGRCALTEQPRSRRVRTVSVD